MDFLLEEVDFFSFLKRQNLLQILKLTKETAGSAYGFYLSHKNIIRGEKE